MPVAMKLDSYVPHHQFATRHERWIAATPARVWAELMTLDARTSLTIRLLFFLRGIPPDYARGREGLDRFGFTLLEEDPQRELVLGLTGRFWAMNGGIERLTRSEFVAYSTPQRVQAAWNFHLADDEGGTRVTTETRVQCTDAVALGSFKPYWRVVKPFSGVIRREMLRLLARKAAAEIPSAPSRPTTCRP